MSFKAIDRKGKTTSILLIVWFSLGIINHAMWLMEYGWLSENYKASLLHKVIWDASIITEPIAILLLLFKPKTGLLLSVFLLLIGTIHNFSYYFEGMFFHFYSWSGFAEAYWMLFLRLGFTIFIITRFKLIIPK